MAMLAKNHVFDHGGLTYVISPSLISEEPMTYSLLVTRGQTDAQQGAFGRFRWVCEEWPYGQAFIETDQLLEHLFKLVEAGVKRQKS